MVEPERTPDGHHIVVNGRRWRATDPLIPEDRGAELRSILMAWRRAVRDTDGSRAARDGVQAAKVALGERGRRGGNSPRTTAAPGGRRTCRGPATPTRLTGTDRRRR